jgi:molybdopterin-guanine dinucleotide biosynthesis protein A
MIPEGQLTGAVLAGGQSRRMGRDKAALLVAGEPLWCRQARILREAGAVTVGLVRRTGQPDLWLPADIHLWHDTVPGAGPLAGVQAALAGGATGFVAVLATDMPKIDADWFRQLARHCVAGAGALARHEDGTYEPLAAIYPRSALAIAVRRLRAGQFVLQEFAGELVAAGRMASLPVPAGERWRVASWNSPADTLPV